MWGFRIRPFLGSHRDQRDTAPVVQKPCDIPGCQHVGDFKAPKSRYDLKDYYWFCLDHVREYNANWDFFKGMTPGEIETHMHKNAVWDRPTWRSTEAGLNDSKTRQKIYDQFARGESVFGDFKMDGEEQKEAHIDIGTIPHPTIEALDVFGLAPPIDWEQVKARYKKLAKQHHPDMNPGDKDAEEKLKKINLAYTILKLSYQHYTTLDEK